MLAHVARSAQTAGDSDSSKHESPQSPKRLRGLLLFLMGPARFVPSGSRQRPAPALAGEVSEAA
jgi:hypothetical protein